MTIDYIVDDLMDNLDHGSAKTNPKLKRQIVETYIRLAHQEGRTSVLAELNHETRQLLDGFGHPKDCEMCRPINQERE